MAKHLAVVPFAFACLFGLAGSAQAQSQGVGVEVTGPSTSPGPTVSPEPTTSPSSGPGATSNAGDGSGTPAAGSTVLGVDEPRGGGDGKLPFTGVELLSLLVAALALVVMGVCLRIFGRWAERRRSAGFS